MLKIYQLFLENMLTNNEHTFILFVDVLETQNVEAERGQRENGSNRLFRLVQVNGGTRRGTVKTKCIVNLHWDGEALRHTF